MGDLNNCAFTGIVVDKKAAREVGSSRVTNFTIEWQKVLPDGQVIKSWPKMEAWGNNSEKMENIPLGSLVSAVGEYQVKKSKETSDYFHSFNVRSIEDLNAREKSDI